jgi:hypothetical protein
MSKKVSSYLGSVSARHMSVSVTTRQDCPAIVEGVNRVVQPREVSCSSQIFLPTSTLGRIPASAGMAG